MHELGSHIGAAGFNIWRMQEGTPNYDKLVFRLYKKANHNMKLSVDRLQGSAPVYPRRDVACACDAN